MDDRVECTYKDKCYRKKYEHFEQYKHSHLDELLERIGVHEIHVPFGFIPSISFATLKVQLEIQRKIRAAVILNESEPSNKKIKTAEENTLDEKEDSSLKMSDDALQTTDDALQTSSQPKSNKQLTQSSQERPARLSQDKSNGNLNTEVSAATSSTENTTLSDLAVPGTSYSSSQNVSLSQPGKKSFEKQSVCAARHSNNMKQADEFRKLVQSQIKLNIGDKLRAAAPYNILYTTLGVSSSSSPDRLAVTFPELLDSPLGLLENSLLINFMVQFGWILACYFTMGHSNKPMTLLYGETDLELGTKFKKFLTYAKVKPPSPFGSHHTKMMIFQYLDMSIRVVICTANLIESDWVDRTQGVWISDKCEEMLPDETGGESRTFFKRDLLAYLRAYGLSILNPWIEKVEKADMSRINVFFIGSVPGSHKVSEGKWGQARLRKVLKEHAPVIDSNSYKVITQISSIGSLGPNPDSWLMGDILTTMSMTKSTSLLSRPILSVIYPSFSNVESSIDGLLGGGCLPYSSTTHQRQEWLTHYLYQWKSDKIGRTRAVPHIKSYTRVSPDHSRISYFLLTSANLSKAAWGTITKSQNISILSYEAGVLLLPQFIYEDDSNYIPLKEETDLNEDERKPEFSLPYDLPLSPYSDVDIPWFIDNLPS